MLATDDGEYMYLGIYVVYWDFSPSLFETPQGLGGSPQAFLVASHSFGLLLSGFLVGAYTPKNSTNDEGRRGPGYVPGPIAGIRRNDGVLDGASTPETATAVPETHRSAEICPPSPSPLSSTRTPREGRAVFIWCRAGGSLSDICAGCVSQTLRRLISLPPPGRLPAMRDDLDAEYDRSIFVIMEAMGAPPLGTPVSFPAAWRRHDLLSISDAGAVALPPPPRRRGAVFD